MSTERRDPQNDRRSTYDSRPDTWEHIWNVQDLMLDVIQDLQRRSLEHDQAKLHTPEVEAFNKFTPKLKESAYDSEEYRENLKGLGPALEHHYATYRHHPEHFPHGVRDMNLVDLIEMLCDWYAATMRTAKGDIEFSIYKNAERFGYGEELTNLLLNTAEYLGMTPRT